MKGKLVCISGIDGSGKSSIIESLVRYYEKADAIAFDAMQPCRYLNNLKNTLGEFTKEKMFKVLGAEIPNICYCADFHYNVIHQIAPAISTNKLVFIHRYDLCCKAYSMLSGCDMELIDSLLSPMPKPDLHFYLDVDIEVAIGRINQRRSKEGKAVTEKENMSTLSRALDNYNSLLMQDKYSDVIRINNNEGLQECLNQILAFTEPLLKKEQLYGCS